MSEAVEEQKDIEQPEGDKGPQDPPPAEEQKTGEGEAEKPE